MSPSTTIQNLTEKLIQSAKSLGTAVEKKSVNEISDWLETLSPEENPKTQAAVQALCDLLFQLEQTGDASVFTVPLEAFLKKPEPLVQALPPNLPKPGSQPARTAEPVSSPFLLNAYETLADSLRDAFGRAEGVESEAFTRVYSLCVCFSLETALAKYLEPAIRKLWASRQDILKPVLDWTKPQLDFTPQFRTELTTALTQFEKATPVISLTPLLVSIRHILATKEASHYSASLGEYGLFILLAGQDGTSLGTKTENKLHISFAHSATALDVFLRLVRLGSVRAQILNLSQPVTTAILQRLLQDVGYIEAAFSHLVRNPGAGHQEAA